jgi:hypothetical protein
MTTGVPAIRSPTPSIACPSVIATFMMMVTRPHRRKHLPHRVAKKPPLWQGVSPSATVDGPAVVVFGNSSQSASLNLASVKESP